MSFLYGIHVSKIQTEACNRLNDNNLHNWEIWSRSVDPRLPTHAVPKDRVGREMEDRVYWIASFVNIKKNTREFERYSKDYSLQALGFAGALCLSSLSDAKIDQLLKMIIVSQFPFLSREDRPHNGPPGVWVKS